MNDPLMLGIEIWKKNFGTSTIVFLNEFLQVFKNYIAQYAKIFLDVEQIRYLANMVDPTNTKMLDFLEYLIFFENFWLTPSKRMRIFKHNIPLTNTIYPYISPITLNFTIYNKFSKNLRKQSFDINDEKLMTIGNNPEMNDITVPELKNSIQLGFVLCDQGILIRDYGKGSFRSMFKLKENDKFHLDNDMLIKIGKETIFKVKNVNPPQKLCEEIDKKHRCLNVQYKGFEDYLIEFYEMQKNYEKNFKDVKSFREMKEKNEKERKNNFEKNESKTLELEMIEGLQKNETFKLIFNNLKQDFIIGRSGKNSLDIDLKAMSVSKTHCQISFHKKCGWILSEVFIF